MSTWIFLCKGAGAALLFSACALAGVGRGRRARRRACLLDEMARFLGAGQAELTYRRERSLALLRRAAHAEAYRELPLDFSGSGPPPQIVARALDVFCAATRPHLSAQEQELFCSAVRCVGAQDASEQAGQLEAARKRLEQAQRHAEGQAADETRLFRAVGVCAGCAAVLLLL